MHLHRLTCATLATLAVAALFPATTLAQSQIGGQVTDRSSDGLPGVIVQATGPNLLVGRATVTNTQGNYVFGDLPPGTYEMTFILPGFSTVVLENIDLAADTNLRIGAELQAGAAAERITISGQAPGIEGAGIIQLCDVGPDGVVGRCRSIIGTARLFR
jgi:hypothetical protein